MSIDNFNFQFGMLIGALSERFNPECRLYCRISLEDFLKCVNEYMSKFVIRNLTIYMCLCIMEIYYHDSQISYAEDDDENNPDYYIETKDYAETKDDKYIKFRMNKYKYPELYIYTK